MKLEKETGNNKSKFMTPKANWIPLNERLPTHQGNTLLYTTSHPECVIFCWYAAKNRKWYYASGDSKSIGNSIPAKKLHFCTHWLEYNTPKIF